jgi:hypothetical protein
MGGHNNTTHMHQSLIPGKAHVVESWVTRVANQDKDLGYNLPAGTWMVQVKVEDKAYWQKEIATGKLTGFSLEGFFSHELRKPTQTNKQTTKMNVFQKAAQWFAKSDKPETAKVKLAEMLVPVTNEAGENIWLKIDNDSGAVMMVPAEGGELVDVPNGVYSNPDLGELSVEGGVLLMPDGESQTVDQSSAEMETLTLKTGQNIELPVGLQEVEVLGENGAIVGVLRFERTQPAVTDASKGTADVKNPADVAALAEAVAKLTQTLTAQNEQIKRLELNQKAPAGNGVPATQRSGIGGGADATSEHLAALQELWKTKQK